MYRIKFVGQSALIIASEDANWPLVQFKKGKDNANADNANADTLSRLPLPISNKDQPRSAEFFLSHGMP